MTKFEITEAPIRKHFDVFDRIGCLGANRASGFLRAAYSNEETAAMKHIEQVGLKLGAKSAWDKLGNLSLSWPGQTSEFVETASHLDTVPSGGNFDGATGVVSGLVAIEAIFQSKLPLKAGLRLRVWRAEESATFNAVYVGSKGAFGKADPKSLSNRFCGVSLRDAMLSQGADPSLIENKTATISQAEIDSIRAHIELHIEQGNVLEVKQLDIGVVTSIRAPRRYRIVLRGDFDHSGATPMGTEFRRDVNLAMAHMLVELHKLCEAEVQKGNDLIQTVGVINSSRDFNEANAIIYVNATPKVSGFGYFSLDVRSAEAAVLDDYCSRAEKLLTAIAKDFRVDVEVELTGKSEPLEQLDSRIQDVIEHAANRSSLKSLRMPSGAGHDAAIVGSQKKSNGSNVPVGMIFIPCLGGKSHCPEEFASDTAIARGAIVLANAMYELAKT